MYRHQFRALVELGRFEPFLEAASRFNEVTESLALPAFRLWVTVFGDLNEVVAETDFESLDAHWTRFRAAHGDSRFRRAFNELCAHLVPGSARDRVMELMPIRDAAGRTREGFAGT